MNRYTLHRDLTVLVVSPQGKTTLKQLQSGETLLLIAGPRETGTADGVTAAGETVTFFHADLIERSTPLKGPMSADGDTPESFSGSA